MHAKTTLPGQLTKFKPADWRGEPVACTNHAVQTKPSMLPRILISLSFTMPATIRHHDVADKLDLGSAHCWP
jgi:hypothetical protein